jgi:hypothetical protein
MTLRHRLFRRLIAHVPEGQILPWWAIAIRSALFPLEALGYALTRQNHYQIWTDTYIIRGARFSGVFFNAMLHPRRDAVYRFTRKGDLVTAHAFWRPAPSELSTLANSFVLGGESPEDFGFDAVGYAKAICDRCWGPDSC